MMNEESKALEIASLGDGASLAECLEPGVFIDSDHPEIIAFARRHAGNDADATARAVRLYYAVRDGLRYDPYGTPMRAEAYTASATLRAGHGYCINKAGLLAAAARASGIPARVGYADVRNHMTTTRLTALMRTDIFYYHGYTDLWLKGRWVKATSAFNKELTDKFRLLPLDFDGSGDSIYHPYDRDGRRHMEYLAYRGTFKDIPFATISEFFRRYYPWMYPGKDNAETVTGDFAREAEAENAA